MQVSLNPVTLKKLDQFERRRRRLVVTRGICSAIVCLLVSMSIIAFADWLWVLSDRARWALSTLGYAGVAITIWVTSLRLIIRARTQRELAMQVESVEPELRENLLSAIELGSTDPVRIHDSTLFRQLLQDDVGHQMASLDISTLLPMRLIGRWLVATMIIVAACIAMLALPGLPFRQLMTRALLPGANIDRISRIHVTILQPTPHSPTVPQDETVAIRIKTSGGKVDEAILQWQTETGGITRQPMLMRDQAQFVANVTVGDEPIDYRILAGDAVTRKYTIRSKPRPKVLAFHKTYHFPKYSGLENKTVSEPHGDLVVLSGTQVEMVIDLDQEVSQAEIRLRDSDLDQVKVLPLLPDGPRHRRCVLPVTQSAIYKIHLVAKETTFENTFSPNYEIRPEPDLVPRVGFVGLPDTTLLLPPNDILSLEGLAEDDLPLVSLEQYVSINGRKWQKKLIDTPDAQRVTATWQWDLIGLNLKSGDQVTTKLVATDRKGNRGESVPLQIVVSSPDFDPNRHDVTMLKTQLDDRLLHMVDVLDRQTTSAQEIVKRLTDGNLSPKQQDLERVGLRDTADKIHGELNDVLLFVLDTLPKMPAGSDASQLECVGRLLAGLQSRTIRGSANALNKHGLAANDKQIAEDLHRLVETFTQNAEIAKKLQTTYRVFLIHNILTSIAVDIEGIYQLQHQLLKRSGPGSWQHLVRQETVAVNQIRVLDKLVRQFTARLGKRFRYSIPRLLAITREAREKLNDGMESEDKYPALKRSAEWLLQQLESQRNVSAWYGGLASKSNTARTELAKLAGSLYDPLFSLAQHSATVQRLTDMAAQSKDSKTSRDFQLQLQRENVVLGLWIGPGTARFDAWKRLNQVRPDTDPRFAADIGLTRRAVTGVINRSPGAHSEWPGTPAILADIAPAYRTLEAGHAIVQLRSDVQTLLGHERWDMNRVQSRIDHPQQWDAIQTKFAIAAIRLKKAGYPNEVVSTLERLRWSTAVEEAGRKLLARRYETAGQVNATRELAELNDALAASIEQIAPVMAEARAVIAQYVPTIPEMARQAEQQVRRLQQQTLAAADKRPTADDQTAQQEVTGLRRNQQDANRQIDDLLDALVEDANAQDILTEEGRQRARDDDDSVAMVQTPATQMNQTLRQAATAQNPDQQARKLAETAEHQQRVAKRLNQIAEHFHRLEAGEDVAQTRQKLRETERQMGLADQMNQRYNPAQELGELVSKTAEQLMAELEAELAKNPEMQESLSEISHDALQQAKNSLERSAKQEKDLRKRTERSDSSFQAKKAALVGQLREIAQQASQLNRSLIAKAKYAATRGTVKNAQRLLQETERQIQETVQDVEKTTDDNPFDEVMQTARKLASGLKDAAKKLATTKADTAKAQDKSIDADQPHRDARQQEMETARKQFRIQLAREARDRTRQRRQEEQTAKRALQTAENNLRTAKQRVTRAEQTQRKTPDSQSARQHLETARDKQRQAQQQADQAKQARQVASARSAESETAEKELAKLAKPPLNAPNPAAQWADQLTDRAAKATDILANKAKQLAGTPDWSKALKPDAEHLAQAAKRQQPIGQDVTQSAEDVARAGRHEHRLGKPEPSTQLQKAAEDIRDVAETEVPAAQRDFQQAAEASDPKKKDQAQQSKKALAATASAQKAENALNKQAEALGHLLDASDNASNAAQTDMAQSPPTPSGTPQSDTGTQQQDQSGSPTDPSNSGNLSPQQSASSNAANAQSSDSARGQLLARTLDELDRTLAASSANPPANQNESASQMPATLSSLTQATRAQHAQMAATRSQRQSMTLGPPSLADSLDPNGAAVDQMTSSNGALPSVDRTATDQWGQLRQKTADDLTEGRKESVAAEYRKQVQTYFRVIAERARQRNRTGTRAKNKAAK